MIPQDFQIIGLVLFLIGLIMLIGTSLLTLILAIVSEGTLSISLWHEIPKAKSLTYRIFGVILIILGIISIKFREELATFLYFI